MRVVLTLSFVGLALAACSGPIVSERLRPDQPEYEYAGTPHGLYCLPKQYFTLTVKDVPGEVSDDSAADNVQPKESKSPPKLEINLTATTGPDLDHLYRLGLNETWLSTDVISINYIKEAAKGDDEGGPKQSASCLLANITSDVTDATPAIVKDLTKAIFTLATGAGPKVTGGTTAPEIRFVKKVFELDRHFLQRTQDEINGVLRARGFELEVRLKFEGSDQFQGALIMNPDQKPDGENFGVFARIAQPYRISFYQPLTAGAKEFSQLVDDSIVYSHNGLQPFFVAINRSAFVKRVTTIDFSSGYPKTIDTDKKSELNALAEIPLDVVTQIVGAPAAALETDKSRIEKQGTLIDKQKQVIENRKALEAERKKAADQQSGSGQNPNGGDPGGAAPRNQ